MDLNTLRRTYETALTAIAVEAPDVYTALLDSWAAVAAAVDATILETITDRVEKILDPDPEVALPEADTPELAFIDQFVEYVPEVGEHLTAPLQAKYGKTGLRAFAEAVYIIDQSVRLSLTHQRLFATAPENAVSQRVPATEQTLTPTRANMKWHDAILAHGGLDEVTREVIRIRSGWYHQCGLCNSCRLVDGDRVIVDSDMETRILDYRDGTMSAPHTAALQYTDAHMIDPGSLPPDVVDELRQHFSDSELLQITLEVSSWNYQKVLVALAIDPPVSTQGLTAITIDPHGSIQIGELLEPVS